MPIMLLSLGSSNNFCRSAGDSSRRGSSTAADVATDGAASACIGGAAIGGGATGAVIGGRATADAAGADATGAGAAAETVTGPRKARTARISSSMLATVAIRDARSSVISINVRTLKT